MFLPIPFHQAHHLQLQDYNKELDYLNIGYERIIDDASIQIEEFMVKNKFS